MVLKNNIFKINALGYVVAFKINELMSQESIAVLAGSRLLMQTKGINIAVTLI